MSKAQTPSPQHFGNCPTCKKVAVQLYRPFCSARCQQVDLGHWLTETYVIQTDDAQEDQL